MSPNARIRPLGGAGSSSKPRAKSVEFVVKVGGSGNRPALTKTYGIVYQGLATIYA